MPRPSDPNAKIRLLAAAEAEFAKNGLDRAKVENITDRAGLSKGAFYLHFESKADAFRELVETLAARMAALVDGDPRTDEELEKLFGDPTALLADWQARDLETFEFIWQNRSLMRLMLEGGGSASYRHLVDDFGDRATRHIADRLARGVRCGVYRADLDIEVASTFLAGAYDRFARTVVRSLKKPNLGSALRELQRMAIRAVGSDDLIALSDARSKESPKRRRKARNTEEAA